MRLTGSGFGRTVGLQCSDERDVRPLLPHWWVDTDAEPERTWEVPGRAGADDVVRGMELWVAEHAVGVVFVHAGAVAVGDRAILVPGRSTTGKTTLVAALLRAGADYLSDEYALLAPDGSVHPYPRPLRVRTPAGWDVRAPAALGAATRHGPCRVAVVAALVHTGTWAVEDVSPARAALDLLDNTVSAQRAPRAALEAVIAATRGVRTIRGSRAGADDAAVELLDRLAIVDCRSGHG